MEYELYHYGVKGMKWGVRKSQSSGSAKKRSLIGRYIDHEKAKDDARRRSYEKTYDRFGVGGVAVRSVGSYAGKTISKNIVANVLRCAADKYIGKASNPAVQKGLNFAKKAAIMGIEVSKTMDQVQLVVDLIDTAYYAQDPNREARRRITG